MKLNTFYGAFILLFLLNATMAKAQKHSLFTADYTGYNNLNTLQQLNYRILQNNPNVASIHLFTLNSLKDVQEKGKVMIDLPWLPCRKLIFRVNDAAYNDDDNYDWNGEVPGADLPDSVCGDGFLTLVNHGDMGGLMGTIALYKFDAEIKDLTGGIKALVILDQDKLQDQECGNKPTDVSGGEFNPAQVISSDCYKKDLRLLVLYSPDAKDNMVVSVFNGNISPSLQLNAYLSVYKLNTALHNSQVYRDVILAGVEELPGHVEALAPEQELGNLVNDSYVTGLRNQYKADAVLEFILNDFNDVGFPGSITASRIFGLTREIGSYNPNTNQLDKKYGYLFVNINHNYPNLTFTHEMGHLLGGRHDDDNEVKPYLDPNAHGHHFTKWWGPVPTGFYRTATSSRSMISFRKVIPYYSNPYQTYSGVSTGSSEHNNKQRIYQHFNAIAGFYTDGLVGFQNSFTAQQVANPPLPAGITAPCPYHLVLTAQTNHCNAFNSFSHHWAVSYDGITWDDWGYGNSIDISGAENGNILVKLTSTGSGGGGSATTSSTGYATFYGCNGGANTNSAGVPAPGLSPVATADAAVGFAASFSLYPNPARHKFTLGYKLPNDQLVQVQLLDIAGRQRAVLYKGILPANKQQLDLAIPKGLQKGIYILKIRHAAQSRQLKLVIQ